MRTVAKRALEIAARQFGAISWEQLRESGLSAKQIRGRVDDSELLRFGVRSLAFAGSADTFERRAACALLEYPGSGLGYATAVAFYGASGFDKEPIYLAGPRATRLRKMTLDVVVRRPVYLPAHHLVEVNGLVVTTPTRACADIANVRDVQPKRAERVVESLWAARLTNRAELVRMADEWCERGRRGSAFLHEFLESRPVDFLPPESNLERRFIDLIVEAGMPRPRSQVNLGGADWFGRVDLLDPELPLIAEIDSDRFHTATLDVANDESRDAKAVAAGFETERFTEYEVWHKPAVVIARWEAARRRVRRALAG